MLEFQRLARETRSLRRPDGVRIVQAVNSTVTLNLRRLLEGRYDEMTEPPPSRHLESIESTARRLHAQIGAGLHVPGRLIVVGLGAELLPRRPPGTCGEAARNGIVAYDPTLDEYDQSVLCAHGAAHLALDRDGDPYTHSDVWLLTCLLLVPRAAVQTLAPWDLGLRSHCHPWIALAVRDLLLRWETPAVSAS